MYGKISIDDEQSRNKISQLRNLIAECQLLPVECDATSPKDAKVNEELKKRKTSYSPNKPITFN